MSCSLNDSPHRRRLLEDLRRQAFTPARPGPIPRMGMEAEWIPWDARLDRVAPVLDDPEGRGSLRILHEVGAPRGWTVSPGPHGVPCLTHPDGGRVTFEPGGQVEYASPPLDSLAALATHLQDAVPPLIAGARDAGLELLGCGIDPRTPLEDARLVLPGERYASMHRYLARIGDAGPRMMLQTAAAQVNVELGPHLALRWRVLNAAAPFLTAIFANSRVYQERDTGFASYRARQWRLLDRRRTGILGRGPDPAAEYLDFALNAAWMLAPPDRPAEPFAEWLLRGEVSLDDWRRHLTTLFPEVRPRGFLEIRSMDALDPAWFSAPLVLVAGILADRRSLHEAAEVVGAPDSTLLWHAARAGLADPRLGKPAADLFRVALAGAARTGQSGEPLETARRYFETYTARGRTPGGEAVGTAA